MYHYDNSPRPEYPEHHVVQVAWDEATCSRAAEGAHLEFFKGCDPNSARRITCPAPGLPGWATSALQRLPVGWGNPFDFPEQNLHDDVRAWAFSNGCPAPEDDEDFGSPWRRSLIYQYQISYSFFLQSLGSYLSVCRPPAGSLTLSGECFAVQLRDNIRP